MNKTGLAGGWKTVYSERINNFFFSTRLLLSFKSHMVRCVWFVTSEERKWEQFWPIKFTEKERVFPVRPLGVT